jgi:hypothetical protein
MIQATTVQRGQSTAVLQRARLPIVAIAAFAMGALAATAAPHLSVGAAPSSPSAVTFQSASIAAPVVTRAAESGTCGNGAYVTGDMVGDASPATVYANMCGGR